ncbi:MAG: adenylate/guanylate cyclase domain-containing protein, partial [Chloroflexota bacterium]
MDTQVGPEGPGAAASDEPADADAPKDGGSPTLTFLFTDIEGSTRLEQRLGTTRYGALRERHRELLRAAFAAADGTERGTEGDSFFVTFPSAHDAVAAAAAAQRALSAEPWPEDGRVAVRMGIHSGEASLAGGSLVGIDINRAARIAAAAHGGQVVASAVSRALVGEAPGGGLSWLDLGEHRLKDLDAPERLSQLVIEGLAAEFPGLRGTLGAGDLPVPVTTFVGRARELEEASALLAASRLLTLTGPGGTGKTRLALELARRSASAFPDGAWWVPLETIGDAELVPATIAHRLRLPDRGGVDPVARLEQHLGARTTLLVLDNFEQVMGAAPGGPPARGGAPSQGADRPAARRCISPGSRSRWCRRWRPPTLPRNGTSGRWPAPRRRPCSSIALGPCGQAMPRRPRTRARSRRSATVSTACRWPSSWRPPASVCCRPPRSWRASITASRCSRVARATCPPDGRRCAAPSPGATTCWMPTTDGCSRASRCSRAVPTSRPSRRSVGTRRATSSTGSRRWWTRASSDVATPTTASRGSRCSRPSGHVRRSSSRASMPRQRRGSVTPVTTWVSRSGWPAERRPATGRRSIIWSVTTWTCARRSRGRWRRTTRRSPRA